MTFRFHLQHIFVYFSTAVLLRTSSLHAMDSDEYVLGLLSKLEKFKLEFNEANLFVVASLNSNFEASRAAVVTVDQYGPTDASELLTFLQTKIDNVGKLLYLAADRKKLPYFKILRASS